MITVRPGKYSDIDDICHNISKISFSEMVDCGVESAWAAKGRARLCKKDVGLDVLFVDDKPMYALGGVHESFSTVNTWFIATEDFFKAPRSVIVAAREHLKRFVHANRKFNIQSITTSQSPALRKWFKFFGFHEHQRLEKCTVFRYGPAKVTGGQISAKIFD